MATHIISFRIAENATSTARRASLVERIKAEAADQSVWEETTSFCLIQSSKTASELAQTLYLQSDFSAVTDKLLVIDFTRKTYATKGEIDYPNTLAMFLNSNPLLQALRG